MRVKRSGRARMLEAKECRNLFIVLLIVMILRVILVSQEVSE